MATVTATRGADGHMGKDMNKDAGNPWTVAVISPSGEVTGLAVFARLQDGELVTAESTAEDPRGVDWVEVERDAVRLVEAEEKAAARAAERERQREADEEILRTFVRGTSTPVKECTILARTATHMLVRIAGKTDWSGVGSRAYYPVEHKVVRIGATLCGIGPGSDGEDQTLAKCDGRLSKEQRAHLTHIMESASLRATAAKHRKELDAAVAEYRAARKGD